MKNRKEPLWSKILHLIVGDGKSNIRKKTYFITFSLILVGILLTQNGLAAYTTTTDAHGISWTPAAPLSEKRGLAFTVSNACSPNCTLVNISVWTNNTATTAYLALAASPTSNLQTSTITNFVANFSYQLTPGTKYVVLVDKGGSTYNATNEGGSNINNNAGTMLNWTGCYYSSALQAVPCVAVNIVSIQLRNGTADAAPEVIPDLNITLTQPTNASTFTTSNFTAAYSTNITNYANATLYLYNSSGLVQSNTSTQTTLSISYTGLVNGAYYVNATGLNTSGSKAVSETRTITINAAPPDLNISFITPTPANGTTITNTEFSVGAVANITNYANLTIYFYNSTGLVVSNTSTNQSLYTTYSGLVNGTYYINATGLNTSGNKAYTPTRTIIIDNTTYCDYRQVTTEAHAVPWVTPSPLSEKRGLAFTVSNACTPNCTLVNISVNANNTGTTAYLALAATPTSYLQTSTLSNYVANFSYQLTPGTKYVVLVDKGGATYNSTNEGSSSINNNVGTMLNWTGCYYGDALNAVPCVAVNIQTIQIRNGTQTSCTIPAPPIIPDLNITFISPTPTNATTIANTTFSAGAIANITNYANLTIYFYNSTGLVVSNTSTNQSLYTTYSGLVNGTYYINATGLNTSGNKAYTETRTITINTTANTVTVPQSRLHFLFETNYASTGNTTVTLTAGVAGNSIASGASPPFGTNSLLFDGTGWLGCPSCDMSSMATGNINITSCVWEYKNSTTYNQYEKMLRLGSENLRTLWSMNYYEYSSQWKMHFTSDSSGIVYPYNFTSGQWVHLCGRHTTGTNLDEIFINGVKVSEQAATGATNIAFAVQNIAVGASVNLATSASCTTTCLTAGTRLKDLRYYETWLNDSQIAAIYNGGVGTAEDPILGDYTPSIIPDLNVTFVSPTPTNGTTINNVTFSSGVVTNITNFANVTIYFYNSTGLIISNTTTNQSLYTTYNGLINGTYYINATGFNTSGSKAYTETRTIIIQTIEPSPSNQTYTTIYINATFYNGDPITNVNLITNCSNTINTYNFDGSYVINNVDPQQANNIGFYKTDYSIMNTTINNRTILNTTLDVYYIQGSGDKSVYQKFYYQDDTYVNVYGCPTFVSGQHNICYFSNPNTSKNVSLIETKGTNWENSIDIDFTNYNYQSLIGPSIYFTTYVNDTCNLQIGGGNYAYTNYNLNVTSSNMTISVIIYPTNSFFLSIYDEETNALINETMRIEFKSDYYSINTSTDSGYYNVSLIVPGSYEIVYYSPSNTSEYLYPRSYFTTLTNESYQNIRLYHVKSSISSYLVPSVIDENNLYVENATIQMIRGQFENNLYPGYVVEMTVSDSEGKGLLRVVPNTAYYKFFITHPTKGTLSSNYFKITSGTITFQIKTDVDPLFIFKKSGSVSRNTYFNNNTNTISFNYVDSENEVSKGCLKVLKTNINGITTEETTCVDASSGSIVYPITDTNQTSFIATSTLYYGNSTIISSDTVSANYKTSAKTWGNTGIFLTMLLTLFLVFAVGSSAEGVIIAGVGGIIIMGLIGLFAFNWTAIVGVLIVATIMIYKINKA